MFIFKCYATMKVIMPMISRIMLLPVPPLPKPNIATKSQIPIILMKI